MNKERSMDNMEQMKKVLALRQGKGIDIKIIVGESEDEKEKKTDLAPKPKMEEEDESKELEMPISKDMQLEVEPKEDEEEMNGMEDMDKAVMSDMTDYEKEDLAGRKPRSFGERVRQAAMKRNAK